MSVTCPRTRPLLPNRRGAAKRRDVPQADSTLNGLTDPLLLIIPASRFAHALMHVQKIIFDENPNGDAIHRDASGRRRVRGSIRRSPLRRL